MRFQRPLARILFALLPLLGAACASTTEVRNDPQRVLILGDSISIGYTPYVQELLAGEAYVTRAMKPDGEKTENCCGTNFALEHIERWLAQDGGNWDVIHFNFGLHDLKRVHPETGKNSPNPDDPYQADPERYEKQLRWIVRRLKRTGADLIFATTTPVPEGVKPYRDPLDPLTYNEVALRIMSREGVWVNHLYRFVKLQGEGWTKPADVHFTEDGSKALGEEVARAIRVVAKL